MSNSTATDPQAGKDALLVIGAGVVNEEVLKHFVAEFEMHKDTIEVIDVNSEEQLKNAGDLRSKIKKFSNKIEEQRKEETKPLLNQKLKIDSTYKQIKGFADSLLKKIDEKIIPFQEQLIRAKEEAAARHKAEELAKAKANQEALEKAAVETDSEELLEMAATAEVEIKKDEERDIVVKKSVDGAEAKTTLVKNYKARVIDINKVPREYLIIDEKLINKLAREQKEELSIPGIQVYYESSIRSK